MARSPEQPPINDKPKFTREQRNEIGRKWYDDTSFEGRTGAEFKALREEVQKATVLDFARYRDDRDYERLVHENPHAREFMDDTTKYDLVKIYDCRKEIGLSDEQFDKLLSVFDEGIQKRVRTFIADGRAAKAFYKLFSPAELEEHSEEALAAMQNETELQERNIPHERVKLSLFPRKKSKEK